MVVLERKKKGRARTSYSGKSDSKKFICWLECLLCTCVNSQQNYNKIPYKYYWVFLKLYIYILGSVSNERTFKMRGEII